MRRARKRYRKCRGNGDARARRRPFAESLVRNRTVRGGRVQPVLRRSRTSTRVSECAAETGRMGQSIDGELGNFGSGKEGDLQVAAGGVGDHPLGVIMSAKRVV